MRRHQVPAVDPDLDQTRDRRLPGVRPAAGAHPRRGLLLRARADGGADWPVGTFLLRLWAQLVKISPPALTYARRIAKVLLVERVEKLGVAAVQGCRFEHAQASTASG